MVEIRKALIEDGDFILEVRNDESTLKFLHDPKVFSIQDFELWFENSNPEWFIIENDNIKVGYLRTKWIEKNKILQVGADIHPSHRGFGYSKMAYQKLFEHFNYVNKYTLEVFDDNFIAKNLYEKLGFVVVKKYNIENRQSLIMEKNNE
jgi:RimJ/RimL family protein N-acetyltransferase